VGRRDCTVIIADDASISRVHADLVVKPLSRADVADPAVVPRLLVRDLSKFGRAVTRNHRGVRCPVQGGQVPIIASYGGQMPFIEGSGAQCRGFRRPA